MNDIFEVIEKRRAVFPDQFNDKPIPEETIHKILDTANWAPTHKRTEPWRFKVFRGKSKQKLGRFMAEKYKEIAPKFSDFKYKKTQRKFEQSDCVILICMQRSPKGKPPEWEEISSTAMAVQNMWLACTELGVGSYWSSPAQIHHMGEFLDLSDGEKCLGVFYMGYYDGELETGTRKTPIEKKIEWKN